MNNILKKEVEESFNKLFNSNPLVIFSPGRINLIGEHTDYNDGFVFPAAINKGIALAIDKTDAEKSKVYALNKDEIHAFSSMAVQPLENGGWQNYILGVVSEIQKKGITVGNFNAVFSGNIPGGAGMSSSAALENAFVFGLNELFGLGLSKFDMILISQKAEHNFAGVKCGIMDQYASMFGVKNSALLLDCRTMLSKTYDINFKDNILMLINTNVKHDLSESAYNDRRAVCEAVSQKLNVTNLRDVKPKDLNTLKGAISEEDFQKALYVIQENERVLKFGKAIVNDDIEIVGELLYQSHEGLSNQFKVSCKELDFLVDLTKNIPYVLGARMMGGGFGGCTINLVKKSNADDFEDEVHGKFLYEFNKACSVYHVKLSTGTHIMK